MLFSEIALYYKAGSLGRDHTFFDETRNGKEIVRCDALEWVYMALDHAYNVNRISAWVVGFEAGRRPFIYIYSYHELQNENMTN